jgi:hypothetical protein
MSMDEHPEPSDVDRVASAIVDGEAPPPGPAPDDPAVVAAVAEMRAVRARLGRVEAGDAAALAAALEVAHGPVASIEEHRRRRTDLRRIVAGAAAAVVVLVAVAGGVLATRDGDRADEVSTAALGGTTTTTPTEAASGAPGAADSTTSIGAAAAPPAPEDASGYSDQAGVVPVPVDGPELGTFSSLDDLRGRLVVPPTASFGQNSGQEAARTARALSCPPQAIAGLEVLGSAVVDGTRVAVLRDAAGTVSALTLDGCAPLG